MQFLILNLILLLVILIVFILRQWKFGVVLIFVWFYFEDLIRRLIPGQPYQVMIIKEVLIFLVFISFFGAMLFKNKKIYRPAFFDNFLLFGAWCFVEAFNPKMPNLFFAAIGFRSYLWYVLFFWFGYYMFSNKEKLFKFCRILVYTSIFLTLLAIFQYKFFYILPPSLTQAYEAAHEIHSYWRGKIKLVPSVFGTGERYGRFSFFLFLLGLGLLFYLKNSLGQKILLFISTFSALLGVFISGRRTPMYLSFIGLFFWILFYYQKELLKLLDFKIQGSLVAILLLAVFVLGIVIVAFPDVADFFVGSLSSIKNRTILYFKEIVFAARLFGFFGTGLGSRSQGVHYIPQGEEWYQKEIGSRELGIESGIGKVLAELGFVGIILFIFWYGNMFFSWFKQLAKLRQTEFYNLALSIVLFLCLMLIWFFKGHQIFGDGTTLAFFWFFMGILFKLPQLAIINN